MAKEKNLPQTKTTGIVSYKAPTPKVEEEIYNLQEDSALIQYEMNMIELPFFTRDKNVGEAIIKKYIFSGNQYMEVIPSSDKSSGYKIPQEFDEKIFYAIMQLYRKQGKRKIITTLYELLKLAGYGDRKEEYERAAQALDRLSGTEYVFSGIMYDKKNNRRIKERVKNTILQRYGIREIEDLSKEEKEAFGREKANKNVVVIEISSFIEENIAAKGFLYYDAEKLLDVRNSTARKLYLLISKWQGWEKSNSIRRSCNFLASRIPLSWESTNIPGTINALEKAAEELREKSLIGDFILTRRKPLSNSEMIFNFDGAEETAKSREIRRANLELNTETGQEGLIIDAVIDDRQSTIFDTPAFQEIGDIMEMLPESSRTETNRKMIERLRTKGVEYITSNIIYTAKNCKDNFDAYLRKSLEGDYAKGDREKAQLKRKKEHDEEKHSAKKTEELRSSAENAYRKLTQEEKDIWNETAEQSSMFKFMMKPRIARGEITKEDAIKETILVLMMGA